MLSRILPVSSQKQASECAKRTKEAKLVTIFVLSKSVFKRGCTSFFFASLTAGMLSSVEPFKICHFFHKKL